MEVSGSQTVSAQRPVDDSNVTPPNPSGIQQASWKFEPRATQATQQSVVQRTGAKVRDDAPSPMLVIGCLIAFGLLSIAVCVSTLPHYWFFRHQFAGRSKSNRNK